MKQITTAIDSDYIKELNNPLTDNITCPIHEVLTFLFTRRIFSWNINDTPVVVFNLIEDLEIIAKAARNATKRHAISQLWN